MDVNGKIALVAKWIDCAEGNAHGPFWVVIDKLNPEYADSPGFVMLHGHCDYLRVGQSHGLLPSEDEWSYPPPEEWPDEVCKAVALYRLTGEIE